MKLPDYAASAASVRFHREIFQEHLEETAFLYDQRLSFSGSAEHAWRDVAAIEDRIEAHIDALVTGREPALAVCTEAASAGGPGELFAALCVFCRHRNSALTGEVLRRLDDIDDAQVKAVEHALCLEFPSQWVDFVEKALHRHPATTSLLATVSAYRNLPVGPALLQALRSTDPAPLAVVEALGKLRVAEAERDLEKCLQDDDTAIKSVALVALCRIGAQHALRRSYVPAQKETWPRIAIGLGGDRQGCLALLQLAGAGAADSDCLRALGLLGAPAALPILVQYLRRPELAEAAALALHWITGARLWDEIFVPEEVDESELVGAELDAWRERQQAPTRADGSPFGRTVIRLSRDIERWQRWVSEHAASLNTQLRYRNGKLCTPMVLVENLVDAHSDRMLRAFAAQELVIRYGCEIPFDVDMPVAQQLERFVRIKGWVDLAQYTFHPGQWYFAGLLQ